MTTYNLTCYSLDEYADKCAAFGAYKPGKYGQALKFNGWTSFTDALDLARSGWSEHLSETIEIAEEAVKLCEREHTDFTFAPVYDVAGSMVDVARFLSGEPDCMVDYPLTPTSKAGKVITLCAGVAYSGSVSTSTIRQRGQVLVALAIALSRLGHSVEIWADHTSSNYPDVHHTRVLIKGADDALDAERIMFAFCHPAMPRQLGFSALYGQTHGKLAPDSTAPGEPERNLPDGTIYLPTRPGDVRDYLEKCLRELGLITD